MPEFQSEEEKLASLLKKGCKRVNASPSFKSKLLAQLIHEGETLKAGKRWNLWSRPLVWAPVAVTVFVLIIFYAVTGLQQYSPGIISTGSTLPPSSPTVATASTSTSTETESSTTASTVMTTPTGSTSSSTYPSTTYTSTSQPSTSTESTSTTPTSTPTSTPTQPTITTTTTPTSTPTSTSTQPTTTTTTSTTITSTSTTTTTTTIPTPPLIAGTGFLKLLVADDPPQRDVSKINVVLSNVEVSKYIEGEEDESWETLFTEGKTFDLIELKEAGVTALLGEAELDTGLYLQIRMDVEIVDAVIDGQTVDVGVELPGGKLKLVESFDIRENMTTSVTIDFDVDKSLVFTGQGKVLFKPVVLLTVVYE